MLCQGVGKSSGHVAGGIGVGSEVAHVDRTFDVTAEICTASVFKSHIRALVNNLTCTELNLGTVIDTGDTAPGEHQGEVLGPGLLPFPEAALVIAVGAVVVRIDINHVPAGIVVEVILRTHAESVFCGVETPVHREVNHIQPGALCVILFAVVVAIEPCVVGFQHAAFAHVVITLLED